MTDEQIIDLIQNAIDSYEKDAGDLDDTYDIAENIAIALRNAGVLAA